jgi:hypothetical protein
VSGGAIDMQICPLCPLLSFIKHLIPCNGLRIHQTLFDDQIAVIALGRQPLANLDEAPVQFCRLLPVGMVQCAEPGRA